MPPSKKEATANGAAAAADAEVEAEAPPPPAKKLKPAPPPPAAGTAGGYPLEPGIVNPETLATAQEQAVKYQNAQPYKHTTLINPFNPDLLRQVRDEIINNINATYKETDLFKLFQTGDMGNLDQLDPDTAAKLPGLMKLKRALYSDEFRAMVTTVTGCGGLHTRTDCSCNVYAYGCHLLCHDDVIANRRVSWIIYLSDPDEPWTAEDGGALELFPLVDGDKHTPAPNPSVSHLPTFNTMAFFTVTPGVSFHSVQEVFTDSKPRMSISGWYHGDTPPEGADKASLAQLQQRVRQEAVVAHTPIEGGEGALSDEDLGKLIRWVNPVYLDESSWPKIQARFAEEGSVQLHNFIKKGVAEKIVAACIAEDAADRLGAKQLPRYEAGCRDGWAPAGPPHKQRYLRYGGAGEPGEGEGAGALLERVRRQLLCTPAFARLLKAFTSITMLGQAGETRRFRPGMDYTVAHYGILTTDPRLDVVLTFVDDATDEAASAWQAGEVGGFEAYLLAEEEAHEGGAEEVYRVNADAEESGVLNVNAAANTLNLVLRDEGLMRFVKYVSFAAPGSRWDVAMEFLPEDDSDDEEEGEEKEKEGEQEKEEKKAKGGKKAEEEKEGAKGSRKGGEAKKAARKGRKAAAEEEEAEEAAEECD
ncbi:hypothetical protein CHLRE_09g408464v5 [Chlamydomonas reinhardtii]|uniref:Fe2OG dioxygenase domain-containing protein n=1 Tax=Chlamydomonas reinhardtii TaxID=3055 RepID=A0A2K3DFG2_CHLRE|nr:uncharacterized protein CHLRE_09g408464v5 [Chlamydomonas reinhardtii]PNW79265.1 hypothetical protein CHLRE_09g408464v5 [Chlamydomonas reinhardtii]